MEVSSEAPSGEHPDVEPSPAPRPARAKAGGLASHRRARRLRRLAGLAVLLAPTLWVVTTDFLRRGRLLLAFDRPHALGYLGSVVESLIFWSVLLHVAARRRGGFSTAIAALFLLLFTLAMGVEGAFHAFYNIYLSMDGQVHSKSIP